LPVTLAVLRIVESPALGSTVAVTRICAWPPSTIVPRPQLMPAATLSVQVPWLGLTATTVRTVGTGSDTVTPVASDGPRSETTSV